MVLKHICFIPQIEKGKHPLKKKPKNPAFCLEFG